MRFSTRAFWLLSFGSALLCGCLDQQLGAGGGEGGADAEPQDPKAPGKLIGFFGLSGRLQDDTCGAENLGAPDDWSFQVKLSRRGDALYWLNGKEGIVGHIDADGSFSFETRIDTKLTERRGAAKACTIVRRDLASGELEEDKGALSMKLAYAYDQTADSACEELIVGNYGVPQALPCRMTYSLSGAKLEE